jgi:hypothetical protein
VKPSRRHPGGGGAANSATRAEISADPVPLHARARVAARLEKDRAAKMRRHIILGLYITAVAWPLAAAARARRPGVDLVELVCPSINGACLSRAGRFDSARRKAGAPSQAQPGHSRPPTMTRASGPPSAASKLLFQQKVCCVRTPRSVTERRSAAGIESWRAVQRFCTSIAPGPGPHAPQHSPRTGACSAAKDVVSLALGSLTKANHLRIGVR